jgi:hypothetical protein
MRVSRFMAIIAALLGSICHAQVFDGNFGGTVMDGFHLYGISAFAGYSSSAYPTDNSNNVIAGSGRLNATVNYGASTGVGWQHTRGKNTIAARYGLTYGGSSRYQNLNALNHTFSLSASRVLTEKWTFNLSASAVDSTLVQLVYLPSTLDAASQSGATYDQFAAGTLNSAPLNSPVSTSLVGDRVFTYATTATMNYSPSQRWNIHFGAVSAAGQNRSSNQNNGANQPNYYTPHTIGLNAGVGFSYALTPRTDIGADVTATRSSNTYQSGYTTAASLQLGRKMGEHWFLRGSAGINRNLLVHQASGSPSMQQVIGTASLGFQLGTQTFVASYGRNGSDLFGMGIGTNTNTSGSWSWSRPGSSWGLSCSVAYRQMIGTGFATFSGWSISSSFNEAVTDTLHAVLQYVHFHSNGSYFGSTTSVSVDSIRLSLAWAPLIFQPRGSHLPAGSTGRQN